jgi:hypothetical protein
LIPDPKIDDPPRSHASTIRARHSSPRECPVMNAAVVTTLAQDADQPVDVDPHRVVHNAIRLQRQQGVDIPGSPLHDAGLRGYDAFFTGE